MELRLNDISTFDTSPETVVQMLKKYGICIIKDYVNMDDMDLLSDLYSSIMKSGEDNSACFSFDRHPTNDLGVVARVKSGELDDEYLFLKDLFLSDRFSTICQKYFNVDVMVNEDLFFTHEKESDVPILPWHFDRQQSLKFYINLIGADSSNGAFEFDIGSHREGHFRANYYSLAGVPIGKMPNDIPVEELRNPITIDAKAGDMIIFDPDGFHRGGVVSKGKERKVIRGHSHPIPDRGYVAKKFSAHWWLQSSLNIASKLRKRSDRILAPGFLTDSELTRDN